MSLRSTLFRPALTSDSARIAGLHATSWRAAYRGLLPDAYLDTALDGERAQLWRERLSAPSDRRYVLLAEQDDALVGFVCVLLDEEPAWGACLDNLHIRPGYTSHGLGGQLFINAMRWVAREEPTWPLHLWVFEANERARRFYERYGGTAVERLAKAMPGGVAPIALRYIWHDLPQVLDDHHLAAPL